LYKFSYIFLLSFLTLLLSCGHSHDEVKKELEQLKSVENDDFTIAYNYATYLSRSKNISPTEAIPLINELISMGYPTAARYCIDNLERNGIHSADLLALHGLCYQHELQPGLARADLEAALKSDPGNKKIITLLNNPGTKGAGEPELPIHVTLFRKGIVFIQTAQYDSALFYMDKAGTAGEKLQHKHYVTQLERVLEGDKTIKLTPGNYRGYMLKSQGLAAIKAYDQAQGVLDGGLTANPGNLNLILAKALVWVQEGKNETAQQYLWEQEQQGIVIDPAVKQKILKPQNH